MLGNPRVLLRKQPPSPQAVAAVYSGSLGQFLALKKLPSLILVVMGEQGLGSPNYQGKFPGHPMWVLHSHVLELSLRMASSELGDFLKVA